MHERKPHILISLSTAWQHRVGLSMFTYGRLAARAGGVPIRLPLRPRDDPGRRLAHAERLLARCQAVILGGGSDVDPDRYGAEPSLRRIDRQRDAFEVWLIEQARSRRLPMLGICRGCQLLNIVEGGSLRDFRADRALVRVHSRGKPHPVDLAPGTRFGRTMGAERLDAVRSYHGQVIDRLAPSLRIAATAPDGLIEAVERAGGPDDWWATGVQWHPELLLRKRREHRLVDALVAHARR